MDVVRGRFDPEATDSALQSCDACPPTDVEERGGVRFYTWGEDNVVMVGPKLSPPVFDQLGRGGRIAVQDDFVFRTLTTGWMTALIDASLMETASLADAEEFRLLAQGLSQLDAYTFIIKDATFAFDKLVESWSTHPTYSEDRESLESRIRDPAPLRPYLLYAIGNGKDEEGAYMALVLVQPDETSAEDNVGLLRQRIEESISMISGASWADLVNSAEITATGQLLVAKLRGDIRSYPDTIVFSQENLFVHE